MVFLMTWVVWVVAVWTEQEEGSLPGELLMLWVVVAETRAVWVEVVVALDLSGLGLLAMCDAGGDELLVKSYTPTRCFPSSRLTRESSPIEEKLEGGDSFLIIAGFEDLVLLRKLNVPRCVALPSSSSEPSVHGGVWVAAGEGAACTGLRGRISGVLGRFWKL